MSDSITIAPTAADLWQTVREYDEMYWRVKRLGIDTGDMERIKLEIGKIAEDIERKAALKCRLCFKALTDSEKSVGGGLCVKCPRPSAYVEAANV